MKRIVFIGDSITCQGQYISNIDAFLSLKYPYKQYELMNLGVPGETVFGSSEPEHAGGSSARPDVHTRLQKILTQLKPDLVVACYGMNEGAYKPFNEERFQKFKDGIIRLHDAVKKSGASIIHVTPPVYNGNIYGNVLDTYADWLISQRYTAEWNVIDIYGPMKRYLENKRKEPALPVAKEAMHPGEDWHFIISKEILLSLGQKELAKAGSIQDALYFVPEHDTIMKLVRQRQEILKDAWLNHMGFNSAGMNKGRPVGEAIARAAVISRQITHFRQVPPPNPFGHALIPDMIADASIQVINGSFYCYATTDGYDNGLKTSGPPVVWKSEDFVNWRFSGCLFPSAFGHKYWAPSAAIAAHGKYFLYPTINGFMYAAVADKPEGPFKLATGKDTFYLPYTPATLLKSGEGKPPHGIDAEIFVDDDKQAYIYWQLRKAAKLHADMVTVDSAITMIKTPHTVYSEGPIFFKRKGIYYYLYTVGGAEKYQYAYVMGHHSPLGPFTAPTGSNIISTTDYKRHIFGPGHGSVFNIPGTDDYYFAYLEFGRGSTNRQTYVNKLGFNADGTIHPVSLTMEGVGALKKTKSLHSLPVADVFASSVRPNLVIKPEGDTLFRRTESFAPQFATDGANGSRWMPASGDTASWLMMDLGKVQPVKRSDVYFVRPTAGHAYILEYSVDADNWIPCGGHADLKTQSPHTDQVKIKARYLRVRITGGVKGIWEWNLY
ncbi:family 43 glycosylhydrolase [Niabella sp. CC-SYL272]|uniref:family 43 glycosylhydrolase n=1 Tax=Niabella agricola TaxID=2891571 RepID=UPI001F34585F|nr:family 43 glycosylhydrolase [Niabella agricola]MCF3108295.1 family 43 glycosylhydrolase [Niabella agricola]